jgi:ADP-ribosylglycohydrolase
VHANDQLNRAQGCLLGLIAADAFAGPAKFSGQPTANAEFALLLARRLAADRQFNLERVAATYADGDHPDIGNPLARSAPLGIWGAFRQVETLADAARQDTQLTHPDSLCQDAAALLAVTIAAAIRNQLTPRQTCTFALDYARAHNLDASIVNAVATAEHTPQRTHNPVADALHNALFQVLHTLALEQAATSDNAALTGALLGAVHGRSVIPFHWQHMVLTCRPMRGWPGVDRPRSAAYWPTDALILAERLVSAHA